MTTPTQDRLRLRISRIRRLLTRLTERMHHSAWMHPDCCQEATKRRADRLLEHLNELVDNLEFDVILVGAGVLE